MLIAATLLAMDIALAVSSVCFRMIGIHASISLGMALTMRYQMHSFQHPQRARVLDLLLLRGRILQQSDALGCGVGGLQIGERFA